MERCLLNIPPPLGATAVQGAPDQRSHMQCCQLLVFLSSNLGMQPTRSSAVRVDGAMPNSDHKLVGCDEAALGLLGSSMAVFSQSLFVL
jgi:hypothetical protein